MKIYKIFPSLILAVVVSLFLFSKTVSALPSYMNDRPLDGIDLSELGDVFYDIGADSYGDDPYDTQSSAAIFRNTASAGSIASFIITLAGDPNGNTAGIYKYDDGSSPQFVPIFSGTQNSDAPEQATLAFYANGDVEVYGPSSALTVIEGYYTDFGNVFGFYLYYTNPNDFNDTRTFYSQDILNPDENPQALIYQGNNTDSLTLPGLNGGTFTDNEWIIAFEGDEYATSDKNFNDFVFMVESIEPVPEPSTFLLLILGFFGLCGIGFGKKIKK